MPKIEFADLPQRRSAERQWFKVAGPRGFKRFRFICLSAKVLAVWVHFDPAILRNRPCTGVDDCPYCKVGPDRRWQGFLAGLTTDTRQKVVVEVTEGCARKMQKEGILDGSLLGKAFVFYRKAESGKKNGAVYFDLDTPVRQDNLPPGFDPLPSLLRLWGWNDDNADGIAAKNQTPPSAGPQAMTITREELPY